MKPILIVPACGKSTRFNDDGPPKQFREHPSGCLMITEAIRGLSGYSNCINIAVLRDHVGEDKIIRRISREIRDISNGEAICCVHILEESNSAVHTVYQVLNRIGGDFPFVSKDCDNYFELSLPEGEDFVAVGDSHSLEPGDFSKSCVDGCCYGDDGAFCDSIKEKYWLPGGFCAGAYGFVSSKEYLEMADWLGYIDITRPEMPEVYQSDVINHMINLGHKFRCVSVEGYRDFGTPQAWSKELARYDSH
jgi:hypothetical protein